MDYSDLFEKPLSEYTEEELVELRDSLRKERKYPSITKAKNVKTDKVGSLIDKYKLQGTKDQK